MFRLQQIRPQSRMSSGNKYKMTDSDDDDLDENCNVRVQDNNIYFFCSVTSETILELTVNIDILSKELQKFAIQYDIDPPPINIYINSEGGEVHPALSVFDTIRNNKVTINTIISGNASSAATIIALAGSTRKITKNSYMLIHNISSAFWGKMHLKMK